MTKALSLFLGVDKRLTNGFPFLCFSFTAVKIVTTGEIYLPHFITEGNINKLYVNKSKPY